MRFRDNYAQVVLALWAGAVEVFEHGWRRFSFSSIGVSMKEFSFFRGDSDPTKVALKLRKDAPL